MLVYNDFSQRICEALSVDAGQPIEVAASLYNDLGLDSFQAFQLIVVIESLAAVSIPPAELPYLYTMEDAYSYYCSLIDRHE